MFHRIQVSSDDAALQNSGSSLSSSFVAPSISPDGKTAGTSTSPSVITEPMEEDFEDQVVAEHTNDAEAHALTESTCSTFTSESEFESIRAEDVHSVHESDEEEEVLSESSEDTSSEEEEISDFDEEEMEEERSEMSSEDEDWGARE